MLNGQHLRRVMDGAITIVVVADRAVEHVVAENAIKSFHLCGCCLGGLRRDSHSICGYGRAGSNQSAVHFNNACVASLNRPELRVVADMRNRSATTVDETDEKLIGLGFLRDSVNFYIRHKVCLHATRTASQSPVVCGMRGRSMCAASFRAAFKDGRQPRLMASTAHRGTRAS